MRSNRREFLQYASVASAVFAWPTRIGHAADELKPTRACHDGDDATPKQMEGPYFKPSSPERLSLLEGNMPGARLLLSGIVLDTHCRPLPRALLDFWQCDANGDYDNAGFTLRGHQYTDAEGRYRIETVVPGLYPGRTRHIHVKLQAPNRPLITTQLYFPGEQANRRDFLFQKELLIAVQDGDGGNRGRFDFVAG